jgi:hypothetical protein
MLSIRIGAVPVNSGEARNHAKFVGRRDTTSTKQTATRDPFNGTTYFLDRAGLLDVRSQLYTCWNVKRKDM